MDKKPFLIEKVVVDVNTTSKSIADRINSDVSDFLQEQLFPELEKVLMAYNNENRYLRINKLELVTSIRSWEQTPEMIGEIKSEFSDKLIQAHYHTKLATVSDEKSEIQLLSEVFLAYLKTGTIPWYGQLEQLQLFFQEAWGTAFKNREFVSLLNQALAHNVYASQRFVLSGPKEMIHSWLQHVLHSTVKQDNAFIRDAEKDFKSGVVFSLAVIQSLSDQGKRINKNALMKLIVETIQSGNSIATPENIKTFFNLIEQVSGISISKTSFQKVLQQALVRDPVFDKKKVLLEESKEIWVQNAGLVLVHPFLPELFSKVGITDKEKIIYKDKRIVAVQLMHYLATGRDMAHEAEMVLERLLCGLPMHYPVRINEELGKDVKEEADKMLQAVITHWPELKNTSPAGLRQGFFDREGKFMEAENLYKLIVERKTQDILLGKLNWNISYFRLPWLKKPVHIEW